MKYHASPGVANRVTVRAFDTSTGDGIVISDAAERVRATGDCVQRTRHSAVCPWTEDFDTALAVITRDRDDRVHVKDNCHRDGCLQPRVRGGAGDDVLTGGGEFFGERGDDLLRGIDAKFSWDRLHGGPGRDRMEGGGVAPRSFPLPDNFYDDESDSQATRDVIVAGPRARGHVDYSMRRRPMRIDLHDRRIAPEGDVISDVKSITTGAGDDIVIGTGGPNELYGGPGRDRLYGRLGDDRLGGDAGDDRLYGQAGDDLLDGHFDRTSGRDLLVGGEGRDEAHTLEPTHRQEFEPDDVRCDSRDLPVTSDPLDRLRRCQSIAGWEIARLEMKVQPVLTQDGAAFTLRCGPTEFEQVKDENGFTEFITRCRGELILRGGSGAEYGRREFSFETDGTPTGRTPWVTVTVPLTDGGRAAITANEVVSVTAESRSRNGFTNPPAGYRSRLGG